MVIKSHTNVAHFENSCVKQINFAEEYDNMNLYGLIPLRNDILYRGKHVPPYSSSQSQVLPRVRFPSFFKDTCLGRERESGCACVCVGARTHLRNMVNYYAKVLWEQELCLL